MTTAGIPVTWETVDHTAMHVLLGVPDDHVDLSGRQVIDQVRDEHAERFPDCAFNPEEAGW